MVLLDNKQTYHATDGVFMPSVDAGVVQQMFGEDLTLFKSLLTRMLREFSDFALPIRVSPDQQTVRYQLEGRLHKFKGSAGMLGATRLMRFAGAAESALHDSRPVEMIEGILGQLASALITLGEEAEPFLRQKSTSTAFSGARHVNAPAVGGEAINELCLLLDHQNLAAVDKFALLSTSLPAIVGAVRFDHLREAVDNLDFQLGAELLREGLLSRRGQGEGRPKLSDQSST
jgi:HPt (histidine-containing phosphotransfer) domain-containing protein